MKGPQKKQRRRRRAPESNQAAPQSVSHTQYIHNQTANQLILKGKGVDASDIAMLCREVPGFSETCVRDYKEQIDERAKDKAHSRELQSKRDSHARTATYWLAGLIAYGLTLLAVVSVFGPAGAVWNLTLAIGALTGLFRLLLIKWGTKAATQASPRSGQVGGKSVHRRLLSGGRKKMLEHEQDEGPEFSSESELTPETAPAPSPADRPDH